MATSPQPHSTEQQRLEAEGLRASNEQQRVAEELRRQEAEARRVDNEDQRKIAEEARAAAIGDVRDAARALSSALEQMERVEQMRRTLRGVAAPDDTK